MGYIENDERAATPSLDAAAARKRAAVETFVRHETALRRTAGRYSICADDADDALQRALEILLRKAPSDDPGELIRWLQTVTKHEALAVRRERERILSGPAAAGPGEHDGDWVALIPAEADGPPEQALRREAIARSREALQALKPQELRALSLLAEGYSYAEIGEIAGFSQTKVNRCLAEGRERFRSLIARGEDGRRCAEMGPLLSAFCDGEAPAEEASALREHLRACAACRATLRAYRAAPGAAAALAPTLPVGRSLLERAHEALAGLSARLGGGPAAGDPAVSQVAAAGGARGIGMAALAKALAICVGTAGGAAACAATGLVPAPLDLAPREAKAPVLERRGDAALDAAWTNSGPDYETAPESSEGEPPAPGPDPQPAPAPNAAAPAPVAAPTGGAVTYAPPAAAAEPADSPESNASDPAGEFGP